MVDTTARAPPCRRWASAHVTIRTVGIQSIFDDIEIFRLSTQVGLVRTADETRQHPITEIDSSLHPSIYAVMPTDGPSGLAGK
jgi:hypothetical protein